MPATLYTIDQSLDYDFGKETYVPPDTFYLGLSTTAIDSSGSTVTEPADASYERYTIPNDDKTFWSYASGGVILSGSSVSFPQSSEAWGEIVSVFLADSSSGGNVWYYDSLSPSVHIGVNTVVTFEPGTIKIERE